MRRYAHGYKIKVKEKDDVLPMFTFYGMNGEVIEELPFHKMPLEQIHEELKTRGFNLVPNFE